jgi:Fe-S-cluster containining protein
MPKKTKMTGKCCEDIGLAFSPQELEISYRNFLTVNLYKRTADIFMKHDGNQTGHNWQDIHLIYPMLEYIKQNYIHPDGNIKTKYPIYHYRCRHHDIKTGKCSIQHIKPRMCLDFPEKACKFTDCSCAGDKRNLKTDSELVSVSSRKLKNILAQKKLIAK